MAERYDVLILGAGAAGLAAARLLAASGKRVAIIEARNRVGGRILTRHVPRASADTSVAGLDAGEPARATGGVGEGAGSNAESGAGGGSGSTWAVELGAEFVHGLPLATWRLIREAGLTTYELDGSRLSFAGGRLQPARAERGVASVLEEMATWLAGQPEGTDETFAQYLNHAAIDDARRREAVRYVEGFNAADHRIIGIAALVEQQRAEDAIDAERIFHIRAGYDALPSYLRDRTTATGGILFLDRPVAAIEWQRGSVRMAGKDSAGRRFEFHGERAIITLPLGVLHSGAVRFHPEPSNLLSHARRMAMGAVIRVSLLFRTRFWRDHAGRHAALAPCLNELSFLFTDRGVPTTWWTPHPNEAPLITGWIGGPRTAELAGSARAAAELGDRCLDKLAEIFGETRETLAGHLVSWHFHDWSADEFARGAYSYAPAGALRASAAMAEPVDETLYFAGEHVDVTGHWGTVHGALQSGEAAAAKILEAA